MILHLDTRHNVLHLALVRLPQPGFAQLPKKSRQESGRIAGMQCGVATQQTLKFPICRVTTLVTDDLSVVQPGRSLQS